ncbi:MAG TPA: lysylphosphatidylglycerol synthase transmembrane domain-containing protein [Chryseolinea sp.]
MVLKRLKSLNWKLYAKVIFTVLGIGWIINQVDIREVGRYLSDVPVAIMLACVVIFNLSKIFCAIRLNIFFKQEGVFMSEQENIKLYYKGMFYNMLLPGGIGGDGYKGYYLRSTLQVPVKNLVRPILWDRITGALSIAIFILILLNFQPFIPSQQLIKFLLLFSPLFTYIGSMVVSNLVVPSYRNVFHSTTMLSFLNQLLQGIIVTLILYGLQIPERLLDDYLFVFFVSSLATILPITLGGVGIREFVFIKAAEISDIDPGTAVALSVLFFAITLVSSLLGSFVKLNGKRPSVDEKRIP